MYQQTIPNFPDFLVKSTLGVSLATILVLTPFAINNFIQDRPILGIFTIIILVLCSVNAWLCHHGRYILNINLFGIAPVVSVAIAFAIFQLGIAGSYWAYLGLVSFYFLLPEKRAWVANILFIGIITPIALNVLEFPIAMRFLAVMLGVSFFIFLSTHEIYKQHILLKGQAVTDSLSGLYNRTLLQGSLEKAIQQNARTNSTMTLLMIDIDHFKSINDELGHNVGDSVLKELGAFLTQHFRVSDMVFRIGGEEFLTLLYNTDKASSLKVAEKLRKEVEKLSLVSDRAVTISIGISQLEPNMTWGQWMKHGDENLYRAKENGRNQVVA